MGRRRTFTTRHTITRSRWDALRRWVEGDTGWDATPRRPVVATVEPIRCEVCRCWYPFSRWWAHVHLVVHVRQWWRGTSSRP